MKYEKTLKMVDKLYLSPSTTFESVTNPNKQWIYHIANFEGLSVSVYTDVNDVMSIRIDFPFEGRNIMVVLNYDYKDGSWQFDKDTSKNYSYTSKLNKLIESFLLTDEKESQLTSNDTTSNEVTSNEVSTFNSSVSSNDTVKVSTEKQVKKPRNYGYLECVESALKELSQLEYTSISEREDWYNSDRKRKFYEYVSLCNNNYIRITETTINNQLLGYDLAIGLYDSHLNTCTLSVDLSEEKISIKRDGYFRYTQEFKDFGEKEPHLMNADQIKAYVTKIIDYCKVCDGIREKIGNEESTKTAFKALLHSYGITPDALPDKLDIVERDIIPKINGDKVIELDVSEAFNEALKHFAQPKTKEYEVLRQFVYTTQTGFIDRCILEGILTDITYSYDFNGRKTYYRIEGIK